LTSSASNRGARRGILRWTADAYAPHIVFC
jgi:hypothetical protein